jgi:2Fe-2S ferredoxin
MYLIKFWFEQKGKAPVMLKNIESGRSLLELALENRLGLQHQCGGVCACTSCHLYVETGMEFIDEMSTRERDFINRAVNPQKNSRLGCQSLLIEGTGMVTVVIPDQAILPGSRKSSIS